MCNPLGRSFARVEYLAQQEYINQMIQIGHSVRFIYDQLYGENKITMTYKTLCGYVKGASSVRPAISSQSKASLVVSESKARTLAISFDEKAPHFDHQNDISEERQVALMGTSQKS